MEEARKAPEEQEPVRPTKDKKERDDDEDDEDDGTGAVDTAVSIAAALAASDTGPSPAPPPSASSGPGVDEGFRLGVFGGGGRLSRDSGGTYGTVGIYGGTQRGSASVAGEAGASIPSLRDASLRAALKNEFGLFVGARGRLGLMPLHTLMDLALAGSFRFGFLSWSYKNAVTVLEDGAPKEYTSDMVGYWALLLGPAVTLARSEHLSLGVTLLGGGRVYTVNTLNGFRNDVFDDAWTAELTLDVAFRRVGDPME